MASLKASDGFYLNQIRAVSITPFDITKNAPATAGTCYTAKMVINLEMLLFVLSGCACYGKVFKELNYCQVLRHSYERQAMLQLCLF